MRYSTQTYARAAIELLREGKKEDDVIRGVARAMAKREDGIHVEKIGRAIERALVKERGGRWVTIEFAHDPSEDARLEISGLFQKHDRLEFGNNPALRAGVRMTFDGEEEIDMSFDRKLKNLFTSY